MADPKKENKKEVLSDTEQVVANFIGGSLAAITVAAIGPVATLAVGAAVTAYIASEVLKDSDEKKVSTQQTEAPKSDK